MNTHGLALRFAKMIRDKDNGYKLEILQVQPWAIHYKYANAEYVIFALEGGRWVDMDVDDNGVDKIIKNIDREIVGFRKPEGNVIYNSSLDSWGIDVEDGSVAHSLEHMLEVLDRAT